MVCVSRYICVCVIPYITIHLPVHTVPYITSEFELDLHILHLNMNSSMYGKEIY